LSVSSLTASTPVAAAVVPQTQGRNASGDFNKPGPGHMVKDADGDYKPGGAPTSPAATSSRAVLAAMASLTKGG
jgi:hypothetical protein